MSARDDDGRLTAVLSDTGPAFPGTLRDWFAGQALVGLLSDPSQEWPDSQPKAAGWAARAAGSIADAMMAERAKVERGQAPDPPAAARDTVAAQPAPASDDSHVIEEVSQSEAMALLTELRPAAHVPHCLNCGLVLDSARDYCLVCGCEAWLFSQRESDIKCTLRAGHDGDHLNGAVSWGGSS